MPPKAKFTREEIVRAALELTKEQGRAGLTARARAAALGCSAKPIFGLFQNMEEVQREVWIAANGLYQDYLRQDMSSGQYPPYKASGMAYIRFAKEERELFKLLFMGDQSEEARRTQDRQLQPILDLIQKSLGFSRENAYRFHLELWIFVHGMAAMIATSYLDWDADFISGALTDTYTALKRHYQKEENHDGSDPDRGPDQTV